MTLPQGIRDRVLTAAKASPSPSRSTVRMRSAFLVVAGTLGTLALFSSVGGANLGGRSPTFVFVTSLGWAMAALAATLGGAGRGGSMLGRATRTLVVIAGLTAPVIYGWMTGCTMAAEAGSPAAPWAANLGCLAATLLLSTAPFATFVLLRRGSDPVHPRALGAALGAAAGAWGGVLIDMHCPATHWLHVAFAHVLPIVVFAALGALTGKRVFGVR
jgi:hypothetical protein